MSLNAMRDLESGPEGRPASCPGCGSENTHASRSTYPMDVVRLEGRTGSFWRCQHCGDRFIGPAHEEASPRHEHEHQREHHHDHRHRHRGDRSPLDRSVRFERKVRRWLFPILVLLMTVVAVVMILDQRNNETRGPAIESN